jgi:hypothetical protein
VQPLRDYLDKDAQTAPAVSDRVLLKWGRLFDIVLPSATRTCCFTRGKLGLFLPASVPSLTADRVYPNGGAHRLNSPGERRT